MIYKELESQTDLDATIHVSYMEIYQEVGYDLLNQAARSSSVVTPFPKVRFLSKVNNSYKCHRSPVHQIFLMNLILVATQLVSY